MDSSPARKGYSYVSNGACRCFWRGMYVVNCVGRYGAVAARFELSAACSAAIPAAMRVSNGIRTRDILDHNQVLYQLSYTHHGPLYQWRLTNDSVSVTPLGNLRGFLPPGYVASGKGPSDVSIQTVVHGEPDRCYASLW